MTGATTITREDRDRVLRLVLKWLAATKELSDLPEPLLDDMPATAKESLATIGLQFGMAMRMRIPLEYLDLPDDDEETAA